MKSLRHLVVLLLALSLAPFADAANLITTQAKLHIGESATVCGIVASAKYASKTKRQPTFLNLDRPFPRHIFTIVIWGPDRPKFGEPEIKYRGQRICVTGTIKEYDDAAEIIASDPGQISLQ